MLRQLLSGQRAALWYVLLVVCLPLVTLILLGLVQLWQNQWLIPVTLTWLALTIAGFALYRFWPQSAVIPTSLKPANAGNPDTATSAEVREQEQNAIDSVVLPIRIEEREDWTAVDHRVWLKALHAIEQALESKPDWQTLPEQCLKLLPAVSEYYSLEIKGAAPGKSATGQSHTDSTYSFTLPELLLVLSVTSHRYRQLVLSHIPFAERIKMSALLNLYSRQEQFKRGAGWINTARRAARFANPLAAVAAEVRDQLTNRIFTNLSEKVQHDLKRLLLQELVQVSMDLYSGRLKNSAQELELYRSISHRQDAQTHAQPAEPLRVVIIGQVSAGKSSLINGLINRLEAEVDILPTTDRTTLHALRLSTDENSNAEQPHELQHSSQPLHLIDTVGLSDTDESVAACCEIAKDADLLIWVARATQPARAPDARLYKAIDEAFSTEPSKRTPPTLLVVTHVDQLSPKALWTPPYDLHGDDPKALNIRKAIESCKDQIGLSEQHPAVPVSLIANKDHYNVDLVAAQIMNMQAQATNTQFNRRRTEHNKQNATWHERWEQASKLGAVTGKALVRAVIDK